MGRFRRNILCSLLFLFGLSQIVYGQQCDKKECGQKCIYPEWSFDPNEIIGIYGYDEQNYMQKRNFLFYTVYFENDPNSATAPVQEILIIDTLDLTKFNPKDFSFGTFTFRDITVEAIPNVTEFAKDVDMRAFGENIIVRITATFDTATGIIRCHFIAFDPLTMDLTENPFLGVLPPNTDPPIGEGNFTYRIGLLPSITHGDVIENKAYIIFDLNEPIVTNTFINSIDTISPNSNMSYIPSGKNDSTYIISWSGSDAGSGVRDYTVYMSVNGGDFFVWQYNTTTTFDTLVGNIDTTYKFYCIATDNVGLRESAKEFDIQFTIRKTNTSISEREKENSGIKIYPNPANTELNVKRSSQETADYTIYSIVGQAILQGKLLSDFSTIDIKSLANGMYYLKIDNKMFKIIKK